MTTPPSVLLMGANGQVGQELLKALKQDESFAGPVTAVGRDELDLTNLDAIAQQISALNPSLIINAAAYTAVDKAESEPELAHRINAEAPQVMAESAAKCGAALVHISTDYVFPGTEGSPRTETDATGPLSVYGKSKLAGEEAIRATLENHIILRTAWVYGTCGKGNFCKTMLRLAKERDTLGIVADQIGSPTWAKDIADAICQLGDRLISDASLAGTYHFTNSGVASWYDFALAIFEEAQTLGIPLAIQTVNPLTTADYPTPARRPPYSVLNCQKVTQALGTSPPYWRESLRAMLDEYARAETPQMAIAS
ncbi:MAG: dTDP-4-dehydrorhamnose reductase [Cyanobacteria bacterium P01_D01_bin.105]